MKRSYQELRAELDNLLDAIQDPEVDIDEALELHGKAQMVIKDIEKYLEESELKIKRLTAK